LTVRARDLDLAREMAGVDRLQRDVQDCLYAEPSRVALQYQRTSEPNLLVMRTASQYLTMLSLTMAEALRM
jgi:hypothetical protein